jgi:hypothetical protein
LVRLGDPLAGTLAVWAAGRLGGSDLIGRSGAAFEQPGGEVAGELDGALFEDLEGRAALAGVLGEESVEDRVGVIQPLLAQILARIGGVGGAVAHG